MPITPLEIRKQEFKKKVRGYDPHEVREFLELIATELEELLRGNAGLSERVKDMDAKIIQMAARYGVPIQANPLPSAGGTAPATIAGTVLTNAIEVLAMLGYMVISISSFFASSLYLFLMVTSVTPATSATSRCVLRSPQSTDAI